MKIRYSVGVMTKQLYNGIIKIRVSCINLKDTLIMYKILNYHMMRKHYIVVVVITQLYNGILKIRVLYINLKDILIMYGI